MMRATRAALKKLAAGALIFTNLIDFDTLYDHRRDPAGYAAALESFDAELGRLIGAPRNRRSPDHDSRSWL